MAAVERLVNLALFLAAAHTPVTADRIRNEGIYPEGQEEAAFLRMFERDKDDLRSMGFALEVDESGAYRLDARATFAATIELAPEAASVVRVVCSAMLRDPSFPFADDLRLALTKVTAETSPDRVAASARLADEAPGQQGEAVSLLSAASSAGKTVTFGYTNSAGVSAPHTLEPYGLFLHDGRWYAVGRDVARDEVRTYAVTRMADVSANRARPRTPDFTRPAGFDVARFTRLPFQYGPHADEFTATIAIGGSAAWRARALTAGQGELTPVGDGFQWEVSARSAARLVRFVIENGPGLSVTGPPALTDELRNGLARAEALHG